MIFFKQRETNLEQYTKSFFGQPPTGKKSPILFPSIVRKKDLTEFYQFRKNSIHKKIFKQFINQALTSKIQFDFHDNFSNNDIVGFNPIYESIAKETFTKNTNYEFFKFFSLRFAFHEVFFPFRLYEKGGKPPRDSIYEMPLAKRNHIQEKLIYLDSYPMIHLQKNLEKTCV